MTTLSAAQDVRVWFDGDNHEWFVARLGENRTWRVDHVSAALVIALLERPRATDDLLQTLSSRAALPDCEHRLRRLREVGILVDGGAISISRPGEVWRRYGWGDAYDYLIATWDYPFVDYSSGGQSRDIALMRQYEDAMPDTQRFLPPKGEFAWRVPQLDAALQAIDDPDEIRGLGDLIDAVISVAGLPVGWRSSRTGGADHMLRTSPSGGARHPSEIYLINFDIPDRRPGVYHFSVGDGALFRITDSPTLEEAALHLPGAFRLPVRPRALVVITAHVPRNMYRYRDPRTLRTLFYDVGHLGGLVESLFDGLGSVAHGHQGFEDSYLSALLRCQSLAVEAPVYLISIGGVDELASSITRVGVSRLFA